MGYDTEQLMEYLPWAKGFARSCASKLPSHLDRDDLQSAGVLGYLRAAARYDVSKGASFRGFCAVRIRGAVLDELRRWDWAPRSVHKNNRRITRITSILIVKLEREPTVNELAEALGIDVNELSSLQHLSQPRVLVSFEESGDNAYGEESLSLMERLADSSTPTPDQAVHQDEDRRTLLKCLAGLPKSQALVINQHYLQDVPLRDVADRLRVTPSRVSQLHHQALGRLRQSWNRAEARI
jgi:RNA polymerase sigma factor for flagellar operon FliA